MSRLRRALGAAGEELAARFLESKGLSVVSRNLHVGGGEIDIVARDGSQRVLVEVRTVTGEKDPLVAFDRSKAIQVRRLAGVIRAGRVDLVAIRLTDEAAEIRWVPEAV